MLSILQWQRTSTSQVTPVKNMAFSGFSCYAYAMNKHIARTIAGLGIIAVGVGALLGTLNIINFNDLFHNWWPMLIIGAGILMFIGNPRQYLWPVLIIFAGALLELRELNMLHFNVWQLFWPIVIIAVGLSVLINRTYSHKNVSKKDLDEITAIFAGNKTHNQSKDYKGGEITAVFGGAEIDLREATIKDAAVLNVSAIFGGVTVQVPKNWTVTSKVTPIAGGVENKTEPPTTKGGPTLLIAGDVVFGGVEIKN
jgi:predicted membrane protein